MKKLIYAIALAVMLVSCGGKEETDNTAPNCKIVAPTQGQEYPLDVDLVIKGEGSDAENNITAVQLKVGDKVIDAVSSVPFTYNMPVSGLSEGDLSIELTVTDAGGLVATDRVTVKLSSEAQTRQFNLGYWSEEAQFTVVTDNNWTVDIPSNAWISIWNESGKKWEKKTQIIGTGTTVVKFKSNANDEFQAKSATLKVSTVEENYDIEINQEASIDMFETLEDENFRMAAEISVVLYGADINEDGKFSAAESETDIGIFGFDAGAWGVKSVKGIENFRYIRHLDINKNPEITEVDLSGSPNLMSIHVQGCPGLKSLDLSQVPDLIELGCDFELYTKLDFSKHKKQFHTLAVLNRKENHPSTVDFTGFEGLSRLYLYDNELTEITVKDCTNLWLISIKNNKVTEFDISQVDRDPDNMYVLDGNPLMERLYVWKGFTLDYYSLFSLDNGVEIIEK